jgi:beta-glucosidase
MLKHSSRWFAFAFAVALQPMAAMAAGPAKPAPSESDKRVESILGQMTTAEKIDMLGGVDAFFVRALPRLGVPRLQMADGPMGVRNGGPATATGGLALAASWNPALAERVGTEIGRDARAKGAHFLLAPGVNIYRSPLCGRNFEYMGEDPFLAARTAVGYIKGVQAQGVSATVKHFMGNNSEFDRHNTDSVIDERTMREIYLPTFEAAVKEAHVGAIMDSYNLVNGEHATQSSMLNNQIAKKDWAFDGIIMSDWSATYDAVGAANGGMDIEMPEGVFFNQKNLLPALEQKKVSMATIDDKVRRILRVAVRFGWLDREQEDLSIPRYNPQGREVALQVAREGMVLLKNEGSLLPIDKKKIRSVAVIGPDAYPAAAVGGGSAHVEPFAAVSFLQGLGDRLGVPVYYARGLPSLDDMTFMTPLKTAATEGQDGVHAEYFSSKDLSGTPVLTRTEWRPYVRRGNQLPEGAQSSRRTGYFTPVAAGPHDVFVGSTGEDGGAYRLTIDDKVVFDNWTESRQLVGQTSLTLDAKPHKVVLEQHGRSEWLGSWLTFGILAHGAAVEPEAKAIAAKADVVVLAVGFDAASESEGADRTFTLPPGQDALVEAILAANKNTVVVITSGGAVDMTRWIDRVPAVIQAWYPGQEGGTALEEIVSGEVDPSGRLPVTFERRWEDNPVHDSYYPAEGGQRVVYKEGVFVGYRGYEHNGTKPLFPFGYGLSYTTFTYANLAVAPAAAAGYTVSFDVKNTGTRAGAEVAQVYVGDAHAKVPRPAKELKGFAKLNLAPGEMKHVTVALDDRALSYYDVAGKRWRADGGPYDILVGRSSQQIELRGTLTPRR